MTLVPAAPPGPIAGQPGHFAHHDWIEASLKLLSLPLPQSNLSNGAVTVNNSAAPVLSPCVVTITNPDPAKLLLVALDYAFQATIAQTCFAGVQLSGATVVAGLGARGEQAYTGVSTSTVRPVGTRLVTLNPGATVLTLGGQLAAAGSQSMSFWYLRAVPLGWQ